jgi:plasmid maintenance system antidote protein VapI
MTEYIELTTVGELLKEEFIERLGFLKMLLLRLFLSRLIVFTK